MRPGGPASGQKNAHAYAFGSLGSVVNFAIIFVVQSRRIDLDHSIGGAVR